MSSEPRRCPFCNAVMTPGQRTCPNPECGNPYPFDDEPTTNLPPPAAAPSGRASRAGGSSRGERGGAGGSLGALAPNKTILVLIGVLVLIVLVGFLLFRFGMSFFEAGRPDPSTLATSTAGPVVSSSPPALIGGSPVPGASPSPAAGTQISPSASPSPAAAGVRLKVANTEGQGANMRQRPSTTAPVLRTLAEGTVVEAIGGEQDAENRKWRNVRDPGGATGWVASDLLAPEE